MKFAFFAVFLFLETIRFSSAEETYLYEPSIVSLRGVVTLQDFAGPPNYENTERGDSLERIWVFTLSDPIRVTSAHHDELFYTQENVTEIQLVCSRQCDRQFALSTGRKATLEGTLFPAHTGHHHKGVLMNVQKRK